MHFLNLYKYVCLPCLRLIAVYSKKFSSTVPVERPKPVPLAYSEYETDTKEDLITDSPIYILHGLLGSRTNWNTISKTIAATTNRKVIALDLRNHGDSPHTHEFSFGDLTADLKQLLTEQGSLTGKASIIGHSIGGRIAMAYALEYPQHLRDLVIVDVSPIGIPPGSNYIPRILDALEAIILTPGQTLAEARKEANQQLKKQVKGEKLRNFLLTNLVKDEKTKNFVWKINLQSVKTNFPSLMTFPKFQTTYDKPCLFLAGERSQYLKKEDHEEIRKLFTNPTFEYVKDVGHLIHFENTKLFVKIVCNFLSNNIKLTK